jgi:predicted transcriptional regulator of viral defense system
LFIFFNLFPRQILNKTNPRGFYVIIPPDYSKQGIIPPYLYIDDLMKSLDTPCYVGLLSAAALYGAAHQQPTVYTVITQSPAPRSIDKLKILKNMEIESDL